MEKSTNARVRALATIALVGGLVVLVAVIATSLGGGGSGGPGAPARGAAVAGKVGGSAAGVPAVYVVRNGDTLTSIAAKTGVPLGRIQALNPHVDPQVLISGQKLRLR